MLESFKKHIFQNLSNLEGKKLLVACSGGLDSMVLLELMKTLGYKLGVAHCNFSLRGKESDTDALFVRERSQQLGLTFFARTFDTELFAAEHKVSTQMAARELRYNWFEELLETEKYDYVLTAHHGDDDLETFFINLSRGTGLRGLTGIPVTNNHTIRPLLPFSRIDILEYAKRMELFWREDSSNAKTDYLRNEIRHELIPKYKELGSKALQSFQKTQKYLQGSAKLIEDYILLITQMVFSETDEGFEIDIQKLETLPNTEALLYELLNPFGFTAWKDVSGLLEAQSGKQIYSPSHRLIKDRDVLLLTEIISDENQEFFVSEGISEIQHPIQLNISLVNHFEITNATTIFLDTEKLNFPLVIRKWKEGDSFYPFGMKGKKKLSKLFKDEKLSLVAKEKTWVLTNENDIVWVIGIRADDRFKVSKQTKKILRIDYTPA